MIGLEIKKASGNFRKLFWFWEGNGSALCAWAGVRRSRGSSRSGSRVYWRSQSPTGTRAVRDCQLPQTRVPATAEHSRQISFGVLLFVAANVEALAMWRYFLFV